MKDYYYILGIDKSASIDEIKAAFRKLSFKFHPDQNDGDKYFEDRFKDIREAYEKLSNSAERIKYDVALNLFYNNGKTIYSDQFEQQFRKRYEQELKKKEEELRRKYQTPEQRAREEAEERRLQEEQRRVEERNKLKDELTRLKDLLAAKEKDINEISLKMFRLEAEIREIQKDIKVKESRLNNFRENNYDNLVFNLKQHSEILLVLDYIKKEISKGEQLALLHMVLSYAKAFTISTKYTQEYPNLLKLIMNGKVSYRPFFEVYESLKKSFQDHKPFEMALINYINQ